MISTVPPMYPQVAVVHRDHNLLYFTAANPHSQRNPY